MFSVRLLLFVLILLLPSVASSQPTSSQADAINALRKGGYVIVFRHGATTDQTKVDSMSRPNVSGERQLNQLGREQAKSIRESMHKLKIPVGQVLTSQLQRAADTGKLLGYGEVTTTLDLTESGAALSPEENNRRAQALRRLISTRPPADSNLVLVSHKPNIIDAFGKNWEDIHEGEASVFAPDGNGGYRLIVRIEAGDWGKLEQASN